MDATVINRENYQREVAEEEKTVLLDFWADWCGPCRNLSPVIDEIAREHPEIKVGKVNVDQEEALARQFGVMSIPSLFVLRRGEIVDRSTGAIPKSQILAMLQSACTM